MEKRRPETLALPPAKRLLKADPATPLGAGAMQLAARAPGLLTALHVATPESEVAMQRAMAD
jgi:hypothetical protein